MFSLPEVDDRFPVFPMVGYTHREDPGLSELSTAFLRREETLSCPPLMRRRKMRNCSSREDRYVSISELLGLQIATACLGSTPILVPRPPIHPRVLPEHPPSMAPPRIYIYTCQSCNYHNIMHDDYHPCPRCPPSSGLFRRPLPGFVCFEKLWICWSCGNLNWPEWEACDSCRYPKDTSSVVGWCNNTDFIVLMGKVRNEKVPVESAEAMLWGMTRENRWIEGGARACVEVGDTDGNSGIVNWICELFNWASSLKTKAILGR